MRYFRFIFIVICFIYLISFNCYGDEKAIEQAKLYDMREINQIINNELQENDFKFDFNDILKDSLNGNGFNILQNLKFSFKKIFFEFFAQGDIMKSIIGICILSGIFTSFAEGFKTKEVSEIGFYGCYMAIILLLIKSFSVGIGILENSVQNIINIGKASAPVLTAMLLTRGESSSAGMVMPIIMGSSSLILIVINSIFIPILKMAAVISIVNYITQKEMLSKLSALCTDGLKLCLKGGSIVFMAIISIQKIGSASVDNAITKTMQAGINSVPVVGDVFAGAVQSVFSWSGVLKTGFGIAVIISAVLVEIIPIIKILGLMLSYKLTAVLIEPFCDKRIVGCIDTIGGYMLIALSTLTTILFMMTFTLIIIIATIGG